MQVLCSSMLGPVCSSFGFTDVPMHDSAFQFWTVWTPFGPFSLFVRYNAKNVVTRVYDGFFSFFWVIWITIGTKKDVTEIF